jgi:hypothetical protein
VCIQPLALKSREGGGGSIRQTSAEEARQEQRIEEEQVLTQAHVAAGPPPTLLPLSLARPPPPPSRLVVGCGWLQLVGALACLQRPLPACSICFMASFYNHPSLKNMNSMKGKE